MFRLKHDPQRLEEFKKLVFRKEKKAEKKSIRKTKLKNLGCSMMFVVLVVPKGCRSRDSHRKEITVNPLVQTNVAKERLQQNKE